MPDDYGPGGVWANLVSDSVDAIRSYFPKLRIYERPPDWMSETELESIRTSMTIDIDGDHPFLNALAKDQAAGR